MIFLYTDLTKQSSGPCARLQLSLLYSIAAKPRTPAAAAPATITAPVGWATAPPALELVDCEVDGLGAADELVAALDDAAAVVLGAAVDTDLVDCAAPEDLAIPDDLANPEDPTPPVDLTNPDDPTAPVGFATPDACDPVL